MKEANQKTIFFRLRTMSPIHIGSDEVYEPTGFVVDENKKQLISFDPAAFLETLDSDALAAFSAICQKGTPQSLVEIYKFMNNNKELIVGQPVMVSDAFVGHYQDTLNLKGERIILQNLNKYQIKRTSFNPHENVPYIPGSSIKGSIRTAVLNYRNKGKSSPHFRGNRACSDMEKDLVGGTFATDPFRLIKVSDFVPEGEVKRRIVYGVNRKKKPSKFEARGPEQIFEVVEPGTVFFGSISIAEPPRNAKINKPLNVTELTAALVHFFGTEKKREDNELKTAAITSTKFDLTEKQAPMRIGYHSGAECVTVEGHRNIKIMKARGDKPDYKNHATTFWLAANSKKSTNQELQPLGWVTLEELSAEEVINLKEQSRKERKNNALRQQELLQKKQQEAREREEQLRIQQEEEKQREVAAAAQKLKKKAIGEQWQNMTEEEQEVAIIRGSDIALSQAPDVDPLQKIWPKIDSASPDHQKSLAAAFKERWQNEPDKWQKKKCSKKQFIKVKKVKEILGET